MCRCDRVAVSTRCTATGSVHHETQDTTAQTRPGLRLLPDRPPFSATFCIFITKFSSFRHTRIHRKELTMFRSVLSLNWIPCICVTLLCLLPASSSNAKNFYYRDFADRSFLSVKGDAHRAGHSLRLTAPQPNQNGEAWFQTPVDVRQNHHKRMHRLVSLKGSLLYIG